MDGLDALECGQDPRDEGEAGPGAEHALGAMHALVKAGKVRAIGLSQYSAERLGEAMRAMIDSSPSGRIGTPDDIAAAAAFLLSPDAAFITGTDLLVDGGYCAR